MEFIWALDNRAASRSRQNTSLQATKLIALPAPHTAGPPGRRKRRQGIRTSGFQPAGHTHRSSNHSFKSWLSAPRLLTFPAVVTPGPTGWWNSTSWARRCPLRRNLPAEESVRRARTEFLRRPRRGHRPRPEAQRTGRVGEHRPQPHLPGAGYLYLPTRDPSSPWTTRDPVSEKSTIKEAPFAGSPIRRPRRARPSRSPSSAAPSSMSWSTCAPAPQPSASGRPFGSMTRPTAVRRRRWHGLRTSRRSSPRMTLRRPRSGKPSSKHRLPRLVAT